MLLLMRKKIRQTRTLLRRAELTSWRPLKRQRRTLIFVNAIDTIRRLVPCLKYLGFNVLGLHGNMQQKQRLRAVDRFRCSTGAVLPLVMVCSDVAARGLDIRGVDHIIHYHIPRTPDIYVHRTGRTGRAHAKGMSIAIVTPEDLESYRKVCYTLLNDQDLPAFPIPQPVITELKERLALAVKLDAVEHRNRKEDADVEWHVRTAQDAGLELSGDVRGMFMFPPSS